MGHIKISHVILPLEELKWRAYYKFHANNDSNVLHQQIQSTMNEGRLILPEMKVDKTSSLVRTLNLNNAEVLIGREQAEGAKRKNLIISERRPKDAGDKILDLEVVLEKLLIARSH